MPLFRSVEIMEHLLAASLEQRFDWLGFDHGQGNSIISVVEGGARVEVGELELAAGVCLDDGAGVARDRKTGVAWNWSHLDQWWRLSLTSCSEVTKPDDWSPKLRLASKIQRLRR